MKISLVTVCFNSESTIEDTLKSVLKPMYADLDEADIKRVCDIIKHR